MKKEEIVFTDWHRWLFGTAPPSFTLEAALRAAFIFAVLLLIVRLMGRRLKGEISIAELAVVLTFGGIITKPLHTPNVGVLPAVAVLLALLVMHRLSNWLAYKYRPVELLEQGDVVVVVRDGCLDLPQLQAASVSRDELLGLLRVESVQQLGELWRVYLEADGCFSVYTRPEPQPGLSILPREDAPPPATTGPAQGRLVCASCGYLATATDHAGTHCLRCAAQDWVPATI